MDIDVSITRDELDRFLVEFAPIRIHLTPADEDRRWLELERPSQVELVPGLGVRIVTSGRLRYELLGIGIPASIRKMVILMIPEVISASTARQSLAFRLEVEEADLANVPAIVDGALVTRVNEALTPETTRMIWHFGNALDRRTALPARLEPLDALVTKVTGGAVGVDDQRVCFSLRLALEVKRHRERPTDESRT